MEKKRECAKKRKSALHVLNEKYEGLKSVYASQVRRTPNHCVRF